MGLVVRLRVRLEVNRGRSTTVARGAVVLGATEGSKSMGVGLRVDILTRHADGMVILVVLSDIS